MAQFSRVIRFEGDDGKLYFSDLGEQPTTVPQPGAKLQAFSSLEDVGDTSKARKIGLKKLLAPLPRTDIPIYCVGLNYRSHAKEASLDVPSDPPLWVKPAASLADPYEDIPINKFCASSLLDYEGELVFVTSKECKDITEEEASSFILGYTIGNDLSCRVHQLKEKQGGQFFYAKAFDKFAPMGPYLVSTAVFDKEKHTAHIKTKLNGQEMQNASLADDMVSRPARILSHMSQGTTIPAGTAVMTGTPAGVGFFHDPSVFLKDGDEIEVSIDGLGSLKNKVVFE